MLILSGEVDSEHGPLIPVRVQIDRTLRRAYESVARTLPMPVSGVALIDTGAVQSGIDEAVALSLGLNPVGVSELLTPTGERTKVGVFWGEVAFVETELVPLRQQFLGMKLGYLAGDERVVAILGRDFLSDARLNYDGPAARYTIRFSGGLEEQRSAPREVVWTLLPET